ncbi:hypothetical protein PHMEG_00015923 [Phytophthora megakarya]|uniref:ABC transporter n=1 Tax=Phytophthora megakarya TaxID=4795 RepID=A0A225W1P4_9STRA|nr:hypothetical protein PHMEG_00015923 [Phytophthora megakarya]
MSSDSDSSDSVLAEGFGASNDVDNDQSSDYGDKNAISEPTDSAWADEGERRGGVDVRDKQSGDTGDEEDSEDVHPPKFRQKFHQMHTKTGMNRDSEFVHGFPTTFNSWEESHDAFEDYQSKTFEQVSKRSSTSVAADSSYHKSQQERWISSRKAVTLVPGVWVVYSKTLACTHGQTYEPRGKGKQTHSSVRDTKCTVRVNARVTATSSGIWLLRVTTSGTHNHDLNKFI